MWEVCHKLQTRLLEVGVEIPLDDLRDCGDLGREEMEDWLYDLSLGRNAKLPECLKGRLPQGWKRPPASGPKSPPKPKADGELLLKRLTLAEIVPSPLNPRQQFDEGELKQLAASLKKQGQLQNIVVAQPEDGRYEIIAGERRWRAAKIAGLKTLLCQVLDVTEEEAIYLRGEENEDRKDFTAFDLARWYGQLRDQCGMTQRAIADNLKVSQGHVGNTLALLKLPVAWEAAAISQEISPTCLRHLAPWSHRPQVLEAAAMGVREFSAPAGGEEPITVEEFRELVREAVKQQSRSLDDWGAGRPLFSLTKKRREELDIEEIENKWGHKEPRAFNCQLWDQLQAEAKKKERAKAKEEQQVPAKKTKPKENTGLSEHVLQNLWTDWWRATIAEKLRGKLLKSQKAAVPRLALVISFRNVDFGDAVNRQWLGQKDGWSRPDYCWLAELDGATFDAGLLEHLPAALDADIYWEGDEHEILERFAGVFGVDVNRDWRPEYEWLDLLSPEQLKQLPAAEFVDPEYLVTLDKKDLIERLLEKWPADVGVPKLFRLPEPQ